MAGSVKPRKVKVDEEGWPIAIPSLKPGDFKHGSWQCGSQCCLVGWVGEVFQGNTHAFECGDGLNDNALKFLNKFCEIAQRNICMQSPDSFENRFVNAIQASDAFEGFRRFSDNGRLQPKEAAAAWEKTLEYFGYGATTYVEANRPRKSLSERRSPDLRGDDPRLWSRTS